MSLPKALAASRQCHRLSSTLSIVNRTTCRRSYASVTTKASTSGSPFQVTELGGIKVAARDDGGATTGLSVVLRGGSRYAPLPGLAHLLEKFAWKNTSKRTAFRITRETELLGGVLSSGSARETISVSANCLREDIPYFLEALADVALHTAYTDYEFHDDILPLAQLEYDALQTSAVSLALDSIHNNAFHRGLGSNILASPFTPLHAHDLHSYARDVYTKSNLVLVASGAGVSDLPVEEFWADLPTGKPLTSPPTKYHGGEARIPHSSKENVVAISWPGSALYGPNSSPELHVLSHFLGGFARMPWSRGQSAFSKVSASLSRGTALIATNIPYSDAGLFTIIAAGRSASMPKVASAALKLVKDIASGSVTIKPEEVKRAAASARYITYYTSEARLSNLEPIGQAVLDTGSVPDLDAVVAGYDKVTPEKIKQAAAKMLESRPSVAIVGQVHSLPFFDEL